VQFECILVVALKCRILLEFVEQAVTHYEGVYIGAHKAAKGVLDVADDGLTPDIKTRVDENRASGDLFEASEQRVESRIRFLVNSLNACRVIHVRYRRDIRTLNV